MMNFVDTHCHLASSKLVKDIGSHIQEAKNAGVSKIVDVAYHPGNFKTVINHANRFSCIYAAIGVQPHDAKQFQIETLETIKSLCSKEAKIVAIGEIGMDNFHTLSPLNIQRKCYHSHLDLAAELKKPVIIHMRETFQDIFQGIQDRKSTLAGGVIHCFTGTWEEAKAFLDMGFFISFSGIITFKKSTDLREVAKKIPKDKILIETDSPYLSPEPFRGKLNKPSQVRTIAEFLASLRQENLESIAENTTRNAEKLFALT